VSVAWVVLVDAFERDGVLASVTALIANPKTAEIYRQRQRLGS
jgi:hypothetical protein